MNLFADVLNEDAIDNLTDEQAEDLLARLEAAEERVS